MQLAAKQTCEIPPAKAPEGRSVAGATRYGLNGSPKVLHITPSIGGGGAEAMLCNLVREMHHGSWRSVVVAVNGAAWPDRAAELNRFTEDYYDLEAGSFLSPSVWRAIVAIIRAEKPDVVQTWMHHADFVGGLCARFAGVQHVVWGIHCREIHRNEGESLLRSALFRKGLGLASHFVPERIVSCSQAAITDHGDLGYPVNHMTWIPNGISTRRFAPNPPAIGGLRTELGLEPEAPVVGFVGRFHEMKRLDWFFSAAGVLMQKRPDLQLLLCGGGPSDLTPEAHAAFSALPCTDRVHFLPFRSDIERLYGAMSVFTLTSRTEACPMTVIEAMSCGVPCVTTDVGDCALLVDDADNTVPPGDTNALAAAWERVINLDDAARAELGSRLRQRAVDRFSIQQAARAYENLYQSLVGTPAR